MSNPNDKPNTSTAIALRPEAVTAMADATGFTTPQIHVVKRNLFKNEGDEADLWLFLTTAKRLGADPFAKQIHAVFRWDKSQGKKVMAIQIGIDQLRLTAARTGVFGGRLGPLWKAKGADKPWVDLWEEDGNPYACKVGGWKIGAPQNPTWAVVKWDEFAQTNPEGKLMGLWRTMGAHMLSKVAEAQMLRILFPMETANLRIREETPEADERTQVYTEQEHQRTQAIYNPSNGAAPRRPTTPGWPASPVQEQPDVQDAEFTDVAEPVTEEEIEAVGAAMPEGVANILRGLVSTYYKPEPLSWQGDAKKRAVAAKEVTDRLKLNRFTKPELAAVMSLLHFAVTGEDLSGDEAGAHVSAHFLAALQTCDDSVIDSLHEAARWYVGRKAEAA